MIPLNFDSSDGEFSNLNVKSTMIFNCWKMPMKNVKWPHLSSMLLSVRDFVTSDFCKLSVLCKWSQKKISHWAILIIPKSWNMSCLKWSLVWRICCVLGSGYLLSLSLQICRIRQLWVYDRVRTRSTHRFPAKFELTLLFCSVPLSLCELQRSQ